MKTLRTPCPEGYPPDRIIDLLLLRLPPDRAAAVARHTAHCESCRRDLAAWRNVIERLQTVPYPEAPPTDGELTDRIIERIRSDAAISANRTGWPPWQPLWRWAAAVLLLAGAGIAHLTFRALHQQPAHELAQPPAGGTGAPVSDATAATQHAARWLAASREPDGHWSASRWQAHPSFEIALNALAILTLIEAHQAAPDPDMATAVRQAIGHIAAHRDPEGRFGPHFAAAHYNHAPATLALARGRRLAGAGTVDPILRSAAAWIVQTQNPDGGWGYLDTAEPVSNLAITYWNIHALRDVLHIEDAASARHALERAVRWVRANRQSHHGFGYRLAPPDPTNGSTILDAMGLLCLLDREREPETGSPAPLRPAIENLAQTVGQAAMHPDYYRDYLTATVLTRFDADAMAPAVTVLRNRIRQRQIANGTLSGSWSPDDPWSGTGGRLYATAMAALTLQTTGTP